jgi:site-specific DNA recombinase
MFELYATGEFSLATLRKALQTEFGVSLAKSYLDKLLKNPFYIGTFGWQGKMYPGTHRRLIDSATFESVQAVFQGHNKPKYRRHTFAFAGLLNCGYDGCTVTAEIKKGKYTYYRCTGYRGKCDLPYIREEELGRRLGKVLEDIHIPNTVLEELVAAFHADDSVAKQRHEEVRERLNFRLTAVRRRLEGAYVDKLDGMISEEFWLRKQADWRAEESEALRLLEGLAGPASARFALNACRILELANKAYFLYFKQTPAEQAKLLRLVVSNCRIDAASLYPTYRKPFDLILERAKTKEWYAREDSNL